MSGCGAYRTTPGKSVLVNRAEAPEQAGDAHHYGRRNPDHIMKKSVTTLVALLALSGGATLLQTGCAGTQTRESTGEYIDDASITAKVKAAFVRDPLVKALDVKVETFKGVVQLSGFVDNAEQKSRAEQLARNVSGVTEIRNNISTK